jgi:hypothetical protein
VASIIVQEIENAVLVPKLAIQSLNGNSIVMVVADDGSITPTPVEVEASGDSYSVLKNSTLKEGDQLSSSSISLQFQILPAVLVEPCSWVVGRCASIEPPTNNHHSNKRADPWSRMLLKFLIS